MGISSEWVFEICGVGSFQEEVFEKGEFWIFPWVVVFLKYGFIESMVLIFPEGLEFVLSSCFRRSTFSVITHEFLVCDSTKRWFFMKFSSWILWLTDWSWVQGEKFAEAWKESLKVFKDMKRVIESRVFRQKRVEF